MPNTNKVHEKGPILAMFFKYKSNNLKNKKTFQDWRVDFLKTYWEKIRNSNGYTRGNNLQRQKSSVGSLLIRTSVSLSNALSHFGLKILLEKTFCLEVFRGFSVLLTQLFLNVERQLISRRLSLVVNWIYWLQNSIKSKLTSLSEAKHKHRSGTLRKSWL